MSDHDHDHDDQPPSHADTQSPDWWPTTVDEAVDRLLAILSAENQQTIRDEPDVIAFHFTLGRWIRNTFGLWQGNHALLASCAQRRSRGNHPAAASSASTIHPDAASTIILQALQARLRRHHDQPPPHPSQPT